MIENSVVMSDLSVFADNVPFLEELKGTSFLVTGATGLIGSTIIKCLLKINDVYDAKINIIGLARNSKKCHELFGDCGILWIIQDVIYSLPDKNYQIDYIIHCANSTSSRFYVDYPVENINTAYLGTNNILKYARKYPVKSIVFLSSLECYGTYYDDTKINEDMMGYIKPTDVRSSYSLGKRAVECLCHCYAKEYKIPVKMARLTQTFGAGVSIEDNRVFAQFSKSIIMSDNITLHTEGFSAKPYCYSIDAVRAIIYLLIKGVDGESYNVANEDTYISIRELAQFLIKEFNPACRLKVDKRDNMGYAPETRLNLSTSKLRSLGWEPLYGLKEMFQNLIKFYTTIINK